ncbi:MAG: hypothetical protein RJB68_1821 [Pseudomonadota bacterium]
MPMPIYTPQQKHNRLQSLSPVKRLHLPVPIRTGPPLCDSSLTMLRHPKRELLSRWTQRLHLLNLGLRHQLNRLRTILRWMISLPRALAL